MPASTLISTTERWLRRRVRPSRGRDARSSAPARVASPALRRWLAAGMLLGAALIVVLYVANAIVVGRLIGEVTSLERERDLVRNDNEKLRGELLKLMAVERVTNLAAERLDMVQPLRPPIVLEDTPAGRVTEDAGVSVNPEEADSASADRP